MHRCKLKLLIFFFCFGNLTSNSFSQPVQNFVDYHDKEQKQKRSEGKYVNGFEEGEWKYWYACPACKDGQSGLIKEISNYKNGKLHGKATTYYSNGSKQNEGFFKRNLQDSTFAEWYSCDTCEPGKEGQLKLSGFFDEKVKSGMWTHYYPGGKKFKEELYVNGHPKLANAWDSSGNQSVAQGTGKYIEYAVNTWKKTEDCAFKDSIRSGECTLWYFNGQKKEEGKYLNGQPDGIWNFWHPNGKLNKKAGYSNGTLDGEFIQYFSNGKPEATGNYQKNKKQGLWIMYRNSDSTFQSKDYEGEFREDVQHGLWTYYYSTGVKESFGFFKQGKKDSTWIFLYPTGEKWKEGFFKEDLKNGKWTTWFENGKKLQEGNYLLGKEDGLWTSWYDCQACKTGEERKKDEGYFKNGLMEGEWHGWYPKGNKNYEGKIKDGLKDGEWTFWFVEGKIREKGKYNKGKKQGYWEFYYELGGKESEGNFVDEKHDGKWTYFYSCPECKESDKRQKMREEFVNKGDLNGKTTVWYPDGTIQSETNFKDGRPDGEWRQYGKKGQITMDKIYKDGKLVKDKMPGK